MTHGLLDGGAMRRVWDEAAPQFPAYDLVLPGDHSFICRAETCNAWCCRALSVPLGEAEVERMTKATGLPPGRFLECVDGEPIALPLVQPFLLARAGGSCALLAPGLSCNCYEGRPSACREYPYQVLFVDSKTARIVPPRADYLRALGANPEKVRLDGRNRVLPLLIRHGECPGFTGAPLTSAGWYELVRVTAALQYGGLDAPGGPEGEEPVIVVGMGTPAGQ